MEINEENEIKIKKEEKNKTINQNHDNMINSLQKC